MIEKEMNLYKKMDEESREKLNVISIAHAQLEQSYKKICEESKNKMDVLDHDRAMGELTSDKDREINRLIMDNNYLRTKLSKTQADRDRLSAGIKMKSNKERLCKSQVDYQWKEMKENEKNQLFELKNMLKKREAFVDQLNNMTNTDSTIS